MEQGDPNRKHQNGLSPLAVKVGFGSKSEVAALRQDVRSAPNNGHPAHCIHMSDSEAVLFIALVATALTLSLT